MIANLRMTLLLSVQNHSNGGRNRRRIRPPDEVWWARFSLPGFDAGPSQRVGGMAMDTRQAMKQPEIAIYQ